MSATCDDCRHCRRHRQWYHATFASERVCQKHSAIVMTYDDACEEFERKEAA